MDKELKKIGVLKNKILFRAQRLQIFLNEDVDYLNYILFEIRKIQDLVPMDELLENCENKMEEIVDMENQYGFPFDESKSNMDFFDGVIE